MKYEVEVFARTLSRTIVSVEADDEQAAAAAAVAMVAADIAACDWEDQGGIEREDIDASLTSVEVAEDDAGQCVNCGRTLDMDGSCRGGCGARDAAGVNLDD